MLTLINKYCIIRLTTKKYYFLIRKNMKHSEANNKDRLVDTWANKAMQARGEEPIISNKSQSPLVDTVSSLAMEERERIKQAAEAAAIKQLGKVAKDKSGQKAA